MCIVDKLGYGLVSRSQLRDHFRRTLRTASRRGLQACAAGAVISAGIYSYSLIYPPVPFWTADRAVQFVPHQYSLPETLSDSDKSEIAAAQRECKGVDYALAKICASATAESLKPAIEKSLSHWRSLGVFSREISRSPRSEAGHLIYGCDANVPAPEFLDKVALSPATIYRASETFMQDGFVVVKKTPVNVERLRRLLNIRPDYLTKRSEIPGGNFRTRSVDFPSIVEGEEDALLDTSVHARPHVTLRLTKYQSEILSEISSVMPLVWELLARQRPQTELGNFQVYISDVQLVASEPTAARTQWTTMNGRGAGLTLTVPLTLHVASEHGARLLLPGSQGLRQQLGGSLRALASLLQFGGPVGYRPEIGDVAISDGRLVMREQANRSFSATEAAIVVRFDWKDQKPVGMENPVIAAFYNALATALEGLGLLQRRLTGASVAEHRD